MEEATPQKVRIPRGEVDSNLTPSRQIKCAWRKHRNPGESLRTFAWRMRTEFSSEGLGLGDVAREWMARKKAVAA